MADVTVRTIAPDERDAVLDLLAGWLNDRAFFARYFAFESRLRDDLCFVAEADGRPVSTLQVFRKELRAVEDQTWMWRPIDVERLVARLRVPVAVAGASDLFDQLFPASASRYWLADRF